MDFKGSRSHLQSQNVKLDKIKIMVSTYVHVNTMQGWRFFFFFFIKKKYNKNQIFYFLFKSDFFVGGVSVSFLTISTEIMK